MKRVYLITGADGHLAKAVIKRLRGQDCLIRGLILPGEPGADDGMITYYTGDITKPETLDPFFSGLEGCEIIVLHMAALISVQDEDSAAIREVNAGGTGNIIEKCRQYHADRLLYVSSVHAIPVPENGEVVREIREFSPDRVSGAYGKTKAEATQMVLDAGKDGLDVVVVHPSGIFGPGDSGRNHVTQLIQMYLHHRLPAGVKGGYDFVDVRDAADGIAAAAVRGRSGECYLLTNRYVSIPELLELLRISAGRKRKIPSVRIRTAMAAVPLLKAFSALTGTRPIFTGYALETLASDIRFSHEKASRELKFHPRDIKETVKDTMDYLKGQENSSRPGRRSRRRRRRFPTLTDFARVIAQSQRI